MSKKETVKWTGEHIDLDQESNERFFESMALFAQTRIDAGIDEITISMSQYKSLLTAAAHRSRLLQEQTTLKAGLIEQTAYNQQMEDLVATADCELASTLTKLWDLSSNREKRAIEASWPKWRPGKLVTGSFGYDIASGHSGLIN